MILIRGSTKKIMSQGAKIDHFSFNDRRIHYSLIGNLTVDLSLNDLLFLFKLKLQLTKDYIASIIFMYVDVSCHMATPQQRFSEKQKSSSSPANAPWLIFLNWFWTAGGMIDSY